MAIHLDSILFNIDPKIGVGAVNLRTNAFKSVTLPEWRSGVSKDPVDAPAAYIATAANVQRIVIQALFRRDGKEETAWIEANDASRDSKNILGSIKRFRVDFQDNDERVITIPILNAHLTAVGFHDDVWQWRYQTQKESSGIAGVSSHRVYSILAAPGPPWDVTSGDSYLWPWRELLDFACLWGAGAETLAEAAQKIGAAIMAMGTRNAGKSLLRYDVRDTYNSFANDPFFDLIEFLRTVKGKPYAIHKIDCSDFASMLSTSANAVGCRLSTVVLRTGTQDPNKFLTNPVKPVGADDFAPPFKFRYHEFGFSGDLGPEGTVWDCCFFVDGDDDPVNPPHRALPGLNLRFGNPGEKGYLDRLVRPAFRQIVRPRVEQPARSVTPMIEPVDHLSIPIQDFSATPTLPPPPVDKKFIAQFSLAGIRFAGWTLKRVLLPRLANGDTGIDSFFESTVNPNVTIRLQIEVETTIPGGQDAALSFLRRSATPLTEEMSIRFPLAGPDNVIIVTNIGNLGIQIRNIGFEDFDLTDLHQQIHNLFSFPTRPCPLPQIKLTVSLNTDVKIPQPTSDIAWLKLFTSTGDLFSEQATIYYRPGEGRAHLIDVFEMEGSESKRHYQYFFELP